MYRINQYPVAWLIVVVLGLAAPVLADDPGVEDRRVAAQEAAIDRLQTMAELAGAVPIIVQLRTDALPPIAPRRDTTGGSADVQRRLAQRTRSIARAQDRFAAALADRPTRLSRYRHLPLTALSADADTLRRLRLMPEVLSISEDRPHRPLLNSSVPHMGGTLAYTQGYTGADWAVAVIDTGVQTSHPAFAGRVLMQTEACFSGSGIGSGSGVATGSGSAAISSLCPNLTPCVGTRYPENTACGPGAGIACSGHGSCWHGTHVAGIALGDHSTYRGVAPGATLIPIQVFVIQDGSLVAYDSDIIAGLEHVLALSQDGLAIGAVNLSLGGDTYASTRQCDLESAATKTAIDALRAAGIATVIAAGNNASKTAISTPGCISSAVSVGAADDRDLIPYFSNLAPALSLFAPGVSITSAVLNNGLGSASGTSMAAPHVAGAFALLRQKASDTLVEPDLDQFVAALRLTGTPITYGTNAFSTPRVQLDAALARISAPLPTELILDSEIHPGAITIVSGTFASVTTATAYGGSALQGISTSQPNTVRFTPLTALTPGYYDLYAWWPARTGNTDQAVITVTSADDRVQFMADQQRDQAQWTLFGTYLLGAAAAIEISDSGKPQVMADAVRLVERALTQLIITTADLPSAAVGSVYSVTLTADGGIPPFRWTLQSGALPAGLTLDATTGLIAGSAVTDGVYAVTVQARDATGQQASRNLAIQVLPSTTVINVAAQSNGGTASGSSRYSAAFPVAAVNNGDRTGAHWGAGGGWNDATQAQYPDWVQIDFAGRRTITEIDIVTLQDNYTTALDPTPSMTFTNYGVTAWDIAYWDGTGWVGLPAGSVTANNRVWRRLTFPAVTTERIRVLVKNALAGYSRIVEIEAYGTVAAATRPPTVNITAPTSGSTYSAPAAVTITASAADSDGSIARVDFFAGTTLIATAVEAPHHCAWTDVAAGTYVLTAVAYDNSGANTRSEPVSITVTPPFSAPINVAAQSNGGVASASSVHSAAFPVQTVNNGERRGVSWGNGGGWNDASQNRYPDWVQVNFSGYRTITGIGVVTLQDDYPLPVEPMPTQTFSKYGVTAFDLQYWDGTRWVTVPGGSITGNNRIWRSVTFPAINTDRIRVLINQALAGYSRIVEIEAYAITAE
jgi:subtilisin family serine protease